MADSDNLVPINPLEIIQKRDPIPESVMDSSAWFKTETVELDFGEYVGRPDENVTIHTSMLAYYFANGWWVDAIISKSSGGKWQSVASTTSRQSSSAKANSSAEAKSNGTSSTTSDASNFIGSAWQSSSKGSSKGQSNSQGTQTSSGTNTASGDASSTATQDGGPYWYAATRIRLKRRKMQSELVLKDMIASFTKAYNEGREINNSRYDELVALYAIVLNRTENEANKFSLAIGDFKPLLDRIIESLKDAGTIPEDWLQSRIDDVEREFAALLGKTKSAMISNGTYNGTVWPSVESGILRDKQAALTKLGDEMITIKVDAKIKVTDALISAETRILDAMQKQLLGPTEIRNTVFKWMLDFMERREDDYPGLEQIATIADRLGYGDGAIGGAGA